MDAELDVIFDDFKASINNFIRRKYGPRSDPDEVNHLRLILKQLQQENHELLTDNKILNYRIFVLENQSLPMSSNASQTPVDDSDGHLLTSSSQETNGHQQQPLSIREIVLNLPSYEHCLDFISNNRQIEQEMNNVGLQMGKDLPNELHTLPTKNSQMDNISEADVNDIVLKTEIEYGVTQIRGHLDNVTMEIPNELNAVRREKVDGRSSVSDNQEQLFECYVCNRTTHTLQQLRRHMSAYNRPFSCKLCARSFSCRDKFEAHADTHCSYKYKPFVCLTSRCGKTFNSKGELEQHRRTHTKERPFECHYKGCGRKFSQKSHIVTHIRRHTGEKPFACDCGKRFRQRSNLNYHMLHHESEKTECDEHYQMDLRKRE